ncbi:MM3350-like domain-containing protein [Massariosphaeria phaeospora]|uniref:MM3350-like domain-containing protein n=1 Tax=Massariosphaeria phaeospora TaxID=100035 RepID=A0A7C8M5I9_9PLEO|nr:MM3350-like domain-containing protein [Massariosphaeria phaeospora]
MPKVVKPKRSSTALAPNEKPVAQSGSGNNDNAEATPSSAASTVDSYLLYVQVRHTEDPPVERSLCVPANFTFRQLAQVLMIAFGWARRHGWSFDLNERPEKPGGFRRKTMLTLMENAEVAKMMRNPERNKVAADYTLRDIYESEQYAGKADIIYEYDQRDSWEHNVILLGKADAALRKAMWIPDDMHAFCYSGQGHPIAEDVGGFDGWQDLKVMFTKRGEWYKSVCANGDKKGLNPYEWDMSDVDARLKVIKA